MITYDSAEKLNTRNSAPFCCISSSLHLPCDEQLVAQRFSLLRSFEAVAHLCWILGPLQDGRFQSRFPQCYGRSARTRPNLCGPVFTLGKGQGVTHRRSKVLGFYLWILWIFGRSAPESSVSAQEATSIILLVQIGQALNPAADAATEYMPPKKSLLWLQS